MNPLQTKPTYLNYRPSNASAASTTSFPTSTTSSSKHPIPNSAPTSSLKPSASIPNTASSLLIYIPSLASPNLVQYLTTIFCQHRIQETVLVGSREDVLKALRTEVYTVAGRLRQDVAVNMRVLDAAGVEQGVKGVVKRGLVGVLVSESGGEAQETAAADVLEMGASELEDIWKTSVLPLHALLRHTLPLLSSSGHPNPFFYLDSPVQPPPPTTFATSSRTALLTTISTSQYAKNVSIGPAADNLPAISETQSMRSLRVDTSRDGNWESHDGGDGPASSGSEYSPVQVESPTKLWASWAAQNDYF